MLAIIEKCSEGGDLQDALGRSESQQQFDDSRMTVHHRVVQRRVVLIARGVEQRSL